MRKFLAFFGLALADDLDAARHVSKIHQAHLADAVNTISAKDSALAVKSLEISDVQRSIEDLDAARQRDRAEIRAHVARITALQKDRDNIAGMYQQACDNIERGLAEIADRNQRIIALEEQFVSSQAAKPNQAIWGTPKVKTSTTKKGKK